MPVMRTLWLMLATSLSVCAGVRSGRASAEWITSSSTFEVGKPLLTAIRLVVDDGWHTYWLNPGEGGMKTSVEWELPAGWTAEMAHPVPKRFRNGDLPGFGYDGTVLFPVSLMPPPDVAGPVAMKVRVSWLTCNDDSCVPGNAELTLNLNAGPPKPTADAGILHKALRRIPHLQNDRAKLEVRENPTTLGLTIQLEASRPWDLSRCEVFPATPNAIDPGAEIRFVRNDAGWFAEVPKSEYATEAVEELTLVLAGQGLDEPIELTWQKP